MLPPADAVDPASAASAADAPASVAVVVAAPASVASVPAPVPQTVSFPRAATLLLLSAPAAASTGPRSAAAIRQTGAPLAP